MLKLTKELEAIIAEAANLAGEMGSRYLMPEHVVCALANHRKFSEFYQEYGGDPKKLNRQMIEWLKKFAEKRKNLEEGLELTKDFRNVLEIADQQAQASGKDAIELCHIVMAILVLEDSYAAYYLVGEGTVDVVNLLGELSRAELAKDRNNFTPLSYDSEEMPREDEVSKTSTKRERETASWRRYVECMNQTCKKKNPLIGRTVELERTIQVLCRMDKNNVLYLGEAGVGKTAIAYGLARKIEEGTIPEPLKGAVLYGLEIGNLIAGTQYRGDFEKRFQLVMEGLAKEEKPIVYLDELHMLVGAGAVDGGSLDASNLLKPYLAEGKIRFIGATTYQEYQRFLAGKQGFLRRFQNIDVPEPSEEETITILNGLKSRYERFHKVVYANGVFGYTVMASKKYIHERFLPDKAIDLIDEAGAYRKLHPLKQKKQTIDSDLIDLLLTEICHIPRQAVEQDDLRQLAALEEHLKQKVFGQEEAIEQISNAVKFSRAGLNEEGKPLASFLFVGPTGVGKTESAKALAKELGISLIRFDMSEYAEKHTVAKLIGAPAGYVGYEEGGRLTDEVRKHPNAVLLFDEIEKAHPDIYNVLLQVMDYATLTDNKGQKADFQNIILIMTSNAGASRLGKKMMGFGERNLDEEVLKEAVKHTFQPEFRNRLSRIVYFRGMDEEMAERITEKKLNELKEKLSAKQVQLTVSKEAAEWIAKTGITKEYGAREIDRVIASEVKPLLVSELLFGALKHGGTCKIERREEKLYLSVTKVS